MKFTAALAAIAGLAYGKNNHHVPFTHLQLAQMERVAPAVGRSDVDLPDRLSLAQTETEVAVGAPTAETIGDVGHPDTRGTDVTILDRAASTKDAGIVSYQLFFDAKVDAIVTKLPAVGDYTNGLYDTDTHLCAFRFRWSKPFDGQSDRYMIAVTHDCPTELIPNIGGFKFVISLPANYDATTKKCLVSSSHKDRFNPHIEVPVNQSMITYAESVTKITFEIANESAASHSRFGILLPADYAAEAEGGAVEEDGAWTYTYEILSAAPYSS
jgi:hypothetical protein